MRVLWTPPFLPIKSGEKPYLEVLSRFGYFWIIIYKQQILHSDRLKTLQLISNQWNFTTVTLYQIGFVFTPISKIMKKIFVKVCWQLKTPSRQMSYLYSSDFPFKTFCKLAQHAKTIWKNVWEKSNDAYSLSIGVQTTINHFSIFTFLCFLPQYQRQRKCLFLSERELKKA